MERPKVGQEARLDSFPRALKVAKRPIPKRCPRTSQADFIHSLTIPIPITELLVYRDATRWRGLRVTTDDRVQPRRAIEGRPPPFGRCCEYGPSARCRCCLGCSGIGYAVQIENHVQATRSTI